MGGGPPACNKLLTSTKEKQKYLNKKYARKTERSSEKSAHKQTEQWNQLIISGNPYRDQNHEQRAYHTYRTMALFFFNFSI